MKETRVPTVVAPERTQIATEMDVPWTIALLSNAKTPGVKKSDKVIVVDATPELPEIRIEQVDIQFAVDPGPAEEKRASSKTCNGVVKTRS